MPDIAETGSYEILRQNRGSACLITRAPSTAHFHQAARCDSPAVTRPGALRELLRGHHAGRPAPWEVAP